MSPASPGLAHVASYPGVELSLVDDDRLSGALAIMRDRSQPNEVFRSQCHRSAQVLVRHAAALIGPGLPDVLLVPVLRAGLGLLAAATAAFPGAGTWNAGLYRDERTLRAHWYGTPGPSDLGGRTSGPDPMLATGGTLAAVASALWEAGAGRVVVVCLVCTDEGLERLGEVGPVEVLAAAKDPGLDEHGYIVPGLGDAGDRLFGPKESQRAA